MNLDEIRAAEAGLLLPTYERYPLLIRGGDGVYLEDEKGTRYLDLLSGIGVNALGYGHPAIEQALADGARYPLHLSNLFFHPWQAELALRLTRASGLDRAFFCNSGTEAWEAALKLARLYAKSRAAAGEGVAAPTRFLAVEGSFHGRTMGSVATTHKLKYREPFAPVMPDVDFVPLNDTEALRSMFNDSYCAVLLEAIQGEGGIRPVSEEFMQAARALTKASGAMLVVDEIQAGFGRTGQWFAYQHHGVRPDIVTVAKPLGGGLPLGALLATDEVSSAMHPGLHGTTFGGGPLACRVAIAVFDEIERAGLLAHVAEVGRFFHDGLGQLRSRHRSIVEVRGRGLMLAIELGDAETAKSALQAMMTEHHVLLNRTSETVLRFLPPYVLEKQHVEHALAALDATLGACSGTQLAAASHTGGRIGD